MAKELKVVEAEPEEASEPEQPSLESLQEQIAVLEEKIATLEGSTHNTHSISQEVIDSIVQQAAKRSVQQVAALLRKEADILVTIAGKTIPYGPRPWIVNPAGKL